MGCKSIGWRVDIEVVKARVGEMKLSQGDGREGHRTEAHESDIGRRMGCMFREQTKLELAYIDMDWVGMEDIYVVKWVVFERPQDGGVLQRRSHIRNM